jgi:hypothetical protein
MFAKDKYSTRFRANSVRIDEIFHLDTMLVAGHLAGFQRVKDDFPFMREALLKGGMMLFPGIRGAECVENLEHAIGRLGQLGSLGFLVKASQPVFTVEGEQLKFSWELTRTGWFYARSYEKVLGKVHTWAEGAREQALARALGLDWDSLLRQQAA